MNGNIPRDFEGRALTRQEQLLLLIEQRCIHGDSLDPDNAGRHAYVPSLKGNYIAIDRELFDIGAVTGPDGNVLRALERKGWIEWEPKLGRYACRITEDGKLKAQEIV